MPDGLAALIGKDRSGDVNCYFAVTGFFSRARTRMACNWSHACRGAMMPFAPIRKGGSVSCLVYHFLPALDDFKHESPRKCAETPRKRKNCRGTPAKNRKPPGLRLPDGFLLYRNYGNGIFSECFLCTCIIPPMAEKQSLFA